MTHEAVNAIMEVLASNYPVKHLFRWHNGTESYSDDGADGNGVAYGVALPPTSPGRAMLRQGTTMSIQQMSSDESIPPVGELGVGNGCVRCEDCGQLRARRRRV